MAGEEKRVMIVGIDDSDHSFYALDWTLKRFFTPYVSKHPFKLLIVHAKPPPTSALGLAGPGNIVLDDKTVNFSYLFELGSGEDDIFLVPHL